MRSETFTAFEVAIVKLLLAGDSSVLQVLRVQFEASRVMQRTVTGVGLVVSFLVPEYCSAAPVERKEVYISDLFVEMVGAKNGAAALLLVVAGRLVQLEVATYDDVWPIAPELVSWRYTKEPRDLSFLSP